MATPEYTTVPGDIAIGCDQPVDPEDTGGFAVAADSGDWMFGLGGAWINEFTTTILKARPTRILSK